MSAPLDAVQALGLHQGQVPESGVGFDYRQLADADAKFASSVAERIRRRLLHSVVATGEELQEVKSRLEHGAFTAWVEAELHMTVRTAENMMNGAWLAAQKSEMVSLLPPAALYALAAPSTPEAVQDAIVQRLEAGERIEAPAVREAIREAKAAVQEAKKSPEQRQEEADRERRKADAVRRQRRQQEQEQQAREEAAAKRQQAADKVADFLLDHLGERVSTLSGLMLWVSWVEVTEAIGRRRQEREAPGPTGETEGEWRAHMLGLWKDAPDAVREQFLKAVRSAAGQVQA